MESPKPSCQVQEVPAWRPGSGNSCQATRRRGPVQGRRNSFQGGGGGKGGSRFLVMREVKGLIFGGSGNQIRSEKLDFLSYHFFGYIRPL